MANGARDWAQMDRTILEPGRLAIITFLYPVASLDYLQLKKMLRYTQGNLASHLAKLEAAGYVALEKTYKGKYPKTVCSMTPKGRKAMSDCAARLRSMARFAEDVLTSKT